jgi:hypothetical protein
LSLRRARAAAALAVLCVLGIPSAAFADAGPRAVAAGSSPVATTISLQIGPTGASPDAVPVCSQWFSLRAVITAADGSLTSGQVTLFRDGQSVDTEQISSGQLWARLPDSDCTERVDTWTASFTDPGGVYAASSSPALEVQLVRRTQQLALTADATSWGEPATVTASVVSSLPWGLDAGGTVVMRRDGVEFFCGETSHLGNEAVAQINGLEPGSYTITAQLLESESTHASDVLTTTLVVHPIHGTFHVTAPVRLQDTRRPYPDFCNTDCVYPPVAGGHYVWVPVTRDWTDSTAWVFPDKATAVALNVTSTQASQLGWIAVDAGDQQLPTASTGNLWPGEDVATMTIAKVGTLGWVRMNTSGTTHLVADAVGYWTNDTSGSFVQALTPTRILDTRGGARVGDADRLVPVVGTSAAVPANATAVVVNLTATQSTGRGYVTARAAGTPTDSTSALNLIPGADRSNLAIVALGADGAIALRSPVSPTHLVVDVVGYLSPTSGQTTGPVPPRRLLDTRETEGAPRAGDLVLPVAGRAGVPADASAVWLSVTSTQAAGPGYVTVWPGGTAPLASTGNLAPGHDVAALTLVPLAPDGTVSVRRSTASHVVVDVVGVVDAAR